MSKIMTFLLAFNFTGCASMLPTFPMEPTQQYINKFDYGGYPDDFKETIESYFKDILKDPESARFTNYSKPKKDWLSDNEISGETYMGWLVCVEVNSKNSFGGYVGKEAYALLLRGRGVVYSQRERSTKIVGNGMKPPHKYPIECD